MNKLKLYSMFICLLPLFSGCQVDNYNDLNGSERFFNSLPVAKEGQIILYHHLQEKLASYDLKTKQIDTLGGIEGESFFQYTFIQDRRLYSSGHTHLHSFNIIENNENKLNKLIQLSDHENIFSLGSTDGTFLFVRHYYNDEGEEYEEKREICQLNYTENKETLLSYPQTTGYLTYYGVCIEDKLYFTAYNLKEDYYSIFYIELADLNSKPQFIADNIETPELYNYNNSLVVTDNKNIYIEDLVYPKKSINDIYKGTLFQIGITENADPIFTALNIQTGETYYSRERVIDFIYEDNKVIVYGEGYIDEFEVQ